MTKRKNRTYTDEFRKQAVELVLKEHYKVADAAEALNITPKILYLWISKYKAKAAPGSLDSDEVISDFKHCLKTPKSYCLEGYNAFNLH